MSGPSVLDPAACRDIAKRALSLRASSIPLDDFWHASRDLLLKAADQLIAAAELSERLEDRIHHLAHVGDCKACGDRAQDLRDVVDATGVSP